MYKYSKIINISRIVICALSLLFGLLPIIYSASNIGNILLLIYGFLMLGTIIVKGNRLPVKIFNAVMGIITLTGIIFASILLHAAYFNNYNEDKPATVVVMGCMVHNGNPSLMLTERLNVAYKELSSNPDYLCVVSGGLTPGEPMSEAAVMKQYLIDLGIDSDRIYTEENSTSTQENIEFSTEIISAENLPSNLIIATDSFHQYRCAYYAEQNGYSASSISSLSATGLVPGYYIREMLAILHIVFL